MRKFLATLLVLVMVISIAACGKKPSNDSGKPTGATEKPSKPTDKPEELTPTIADPTPSTDELTPTPTVPGSNSAPEGSVTDEKKLGSSISYKADEEGNIVFFIKTSAYIKRASGWLGLCPLGIYLTEEAADAVDCTYAYFDSSYDKEWIDGIYTFKLQNECIEAGTYTMVLCDDDECGNVIGEWIFNKDRSGNVEIGFDDAWLKGAGEDRHAKDFDSAEEEVASWFSFRECNEEWAEILFDGYYLEQADPYGYDCYYLMVCPEGEYSTYEEAMEAHIGDYSAIFEKCPYLFSIYHPSINPGKYTMVLAQDGRNDLGIGGDVEIQFGIEKVSATEWKFDFSNVKCQTLENR